MESKLPQVQGAHPTFATLRPNVVKLQHGQNKLKISQYQYIPQCHKICMIYTYQLSQKKILKAFYLLES